MMSNVRISESAHAVLRRLADESGDTMQAVEEYRRHRFWDQVEAAAAELCKDPAAGAAELAERQAWESTLADDLGAE
jgi:hypothetical protein